MSDIRKFSIFISSTYEDLIEERQALYSVALENGFIPVGMEQFHGVPISQWDIITKMIDECDFYLLVVGGRYGSIDEDTGLSYTEKEYNYAKSKKMPVLVIIKSENSITADKQDKGDDKHDKQRRLEEFKKRIKNDGITIDTFENTDKLRYVAAQTLRNAVDYANEDSGWVRYKDVKDLINSKDIEQSNVEFNKMFMVDGGNLIIGNGDKIENTIIGNDDVGIISVEAAFLLVYAAEGNGQIIKARYFGSFTHVSASGKSFMAENTHRESARWVEAVDQLIEWGWVKSIGNKNEIFELTGTGYRKADWLKQEMGIDTEKEPLEEIKKFDR